MLLRWLSQLLSSFLFLLFHPSRFDKVLARWTIECSDTLSIHILGKFTMNLTSEQKIKITVRPVTAGGNPARIDGPVTFASENEGVVRIEAIDDMNAYAIAVATGTTRITATFDADLDEGETRFLTFDAEITVENAEAVGAEVAFGTPEYLVLTPIGTYEAHEGTAVDAPAASEEAAPPVDAANDETVADETAASEDPAVEAPTSTDDSEPPASESPADAGDTTGAESPAAP